jgi:L-lactate dehydrogenase complex protein LldG
MNNPTSKDYILGRIRKTKGNRESTTFPILDMSSPIYKQITPSAVDCFKNELESVAGLCTVCNSKTQLFKSLSEWLTEKNISRLFCKDENLKADLLQYNIPNTSDTSDFIPMQAAVTGCEYLVARMGSVVVSAYGASGRQLNIFPPVHIVIARKDQLVDYPEDALTALTQKYKEKIPSMISFISGPSRTADIEKTLVLGAHGPKALHVFIYE